MIPTMKVTKALTKMLNKVVTNVRPKVLTKMIRKIPTKMLNLDLGHRAEIVQGDQVVTKVLKGVEGEGWRVSQGTKRSRRCSSQEFSFVGRMGLMGPMGLYG